MSLKKIAVLGTGGTIAGQAHSSSDNIGYTAAQLGISELLQAIPALGSKVQLFVEQVAQIDSKDMNFAVWGTLKSRTEYFLARDDVAGVVITHGTDTLEETAYFLQSVLRPAKPVVLTCAMRPATSLCSDGPQNLIDAVAVSTQPGAAGVFVVCAGRVHSAREVQKVHPYRLDAFESGDAGPVAFVEEGNVRVIRSWTCPESSNHRDFCSPTMFTGNVEKLPEVEILMSYAGASGNVVRALVAQGKVHGLVIAATGNGSLHHDLEKALLGAQSAGLKVVCATRCPQGRVLPKPSDLFPDSDGLSPVKARIKMMLELLSRQDQTLS